MVVGGRWDPLQGHIVTARLAPLLKKMCNWTSSFFSLQLTILPKKMIPSFLQISESRAGSPGGREAAEQAGGGAVRGTGL